MNALINRKTIFDTVRTMLGRGFKQPEVDRLDKALDAALTPSEFSQIDRVPSVPSCRNRATNWLAFWPPFA